MYPYERSLAKRMKDKPFTILGVNSDSTTEKCLEAKKRDQLNWPSFWDGGTRGPIARRWRVRGWPTFYVIDAKGVIRGIPNARKDIDRLVDDLIEELEKN